MLRKRKNIDLSPDTVRLLGFMAVSEGVSLKAYIERLLDKQAENIKEDALLLAMSREADANVEASEAEQNEIRDILVKST